MSCNSCAEQRYNCYKHHWSDTRKPVCLEVTPGSIDQIDPHTNRVVCSYDYRNVEGFVEVSDYQGGFCILYGGFSRLVCIHRVCVCSSVRVLSCIVVIKLSFNFPPFSHRLFLSAFVCLRASGWHHPQRHRACWELHWYHTTTEEGCPDLWEFHDWQVGEVQLRRQHHITGRVRGAEDHPSTSG